MNIFEYGSPEGIPVVFFFGTPQRGDAGEELHALASTYGIRLICPTRPWYDDQAIAPSFEAVTEPVLAYLGNHGVTSAHAAGGSGGGPFALHLAIHGAPVIADCTLLASMGLPGSFVAQVTSPPTLELLKAFNQRDYESWKNKFANWGLPPDIAHGAWGDFSVFFDHVPQMERRTDRPIHVHQSASDPNAPLESVRELLADAANVEWHIDGAACHIAMANDKTDVMAHRIFAAISSRAERRKN